MTPQKKTTASCRERCSSKLPVLCAKRFRSSGTQLATKALHFAKGSAESCGVRSRRALVMLFQARLMSLRCTAESSTALAARRFSSSSAETSSEAPPTSPRLQAHGPPVLRSATRGGGGGGGVVLACTDPSCCQRPQRSSSSSGGALRGAPDAPRPSGALSRRWLRCGQAPDGGLPRRWLPEGREDAPALLGKGVSGASGEARGAS